MQGRVSDFGGCRVYYRPRFHVGLGAPTLPSVTLAKEMTPGLRCRLSEEEEVKVRTCTPGPYSRDCPAALMELTLGPPGTGFLGGTNLSPI